MLAKLSTLVLAFVFLTSAQTGDLRSRLRDVLVSSGQADRATIALEGGNYREVESILDQVRGTSRAEDSELLAVKAGVQFLERDMARAAVTYSKAAKLGVLSDTDAFTFAMALATGGDADHARTLLNALSAAHPQDALYVYWLGRLDYYQRRYEGAIEKLESAAQLDGGSVRVWDSLGLAYDMRGQTEEAQRALRKAVRLNRDQTRRSPWPANDLGSLLLRMERPREAEEMLRESLRYDPQLAEAHYRLGRALERQGRETEAVEEYQVAVSGDSKSADACYALAFLLRKLHRDKEASTMFAEFEMRKQREDASAAAPVMH